MKCDPLAIFQYTPAYAVFTSLSDKTNRGRESKDQATLSCQAASPTYSLDWDSFPAENLHVMCQALSRGWEPFCPPPFWFSKKKSQRHPASTCTHVVSWWSARWLAHWALSRGVC